MTIRRPSNDRSASSTLVFLLQPPKPAPVVPPAPASHCRLCCRGSLTSHYHSHRWPGHPSTHPHPMLFCGDDSLTPQRTSEPSYSSTRGHPLPRLPRLRVVPFLGIAAIHRPGALGAAWSTWSRNGFHRMWTVRGEADSWVHSRSKEVPPYYAQIIIPPPDSWDPPDGPLYFAKKRFSPDCWDPPATSSHARKCLTVGTHLVEAYAALSF